MEINRVCKEPCLEIFNSFPEKDLLIDDIEDFLKKIYSFIATNYSDLGSIEYLLKLNFSDTESGKNILNASYILKEKSNNKQLYEIDNHLNIISSSRLNDLSDTLLCKHTRDNNSVILFVLNGIDTKLYCRGMIIGEINSLNPGAAPKINKRLGRSAQDYKYSLKDFYKERVRNNVTKHWKDQSKRILLGGKTEDIFQFNLANYLQENINAARVIPKVKKISQDETDIEIIEHGGNSYLIELKWLGVNAAGTPYNESRIRDSFSQVKNYLEIDKEVIEATLVIFDGRTFADYNKLISVDEEIGHWKEIRESMAETLPLKGKGFVFFLISESASQRKSLV
jgi:hypothetical protein